MSAPREKTVKVVASAAVASSGACFHTYLNRKQLYFHQLSKLALVAGFSIEHGGKAEFHPNVSFSLKFSPKLF